MILPLGKVPMYYQLNKDVYFRAYGEVGHITSTGLFNDKVVDASGAVFLDALTREPQHIEVLAEKIASNFADVNSDDILQDVKDFYDIFTEDGFLASGSTVEEARKHVQGFTYDVVEPRTMKYDFTPEKLRAESATQDVLENHFLTDPKLMNFQIELTSRCNERCIHCYIPHEFKEGMISPDLFYSVLDQLEDLSCWQVTLSGGEPMLHPRFKEFLRAAKEKDMYVAVLSNLTLLDDEIVDILKDGNVSSVQVSLYSMNPEHHDAITKLPGSFEKTKVAIEKLIANDIPVQISCPTMKENKDDYVGVMQWAREHKIRAHTDYSIMAEYNNDTSNLSHRLSPEECGEVIKDILGWDSDYQEEILSSDFAAQVLNYENALDAPLCGVGISTCCMVADGSVYPCAGWQSYVCGNLNEDTLDHIWNDSEKMQYLRSLRQRDLKKCADCDDRAFCSPCMVRFANESPTGDPFEISPYFCEVTKVNKDIVLDWRKEQLATRA